MAEFSNGEEEEKELVPESALTAQILHYARLLKVKGIVVGLPLFKDGNESKQSRIVRSYCSNELVVSLCREFGGRWEEGVLVPEVRLFLFDERYSSSSAAAMMSGNKQPVTRDLDAVSACVILSHFCKVNGEGGEEVLLEEDERVTRKLLKEHDELMGAREEEGRRQVRINTIQESRSDMIKRVAMEEQERVGEGGVGRGGGGGKKKEKKRRRKTTKKRLL